MIYVNPNIRASDRDGYVIATFIADTVAELPATNYLTDYTLEIGCTCHVIEDSGDYEMKSDGTWVKRIPAVLANTYTRVEIDTMTGNLSDDIEAEESAREAADAVQIDAVARLIDTGSKNISPINSGSNTLPTRWLQISVDIPAGGYVLYIGSLSSDDTDTNTCQIAFFDSANNAVRYLYPERGAVVIPFTLPADSTFFRIYPSDSYAHSENDTVNVTDLMICTEADYKISTAYVPYCPTVEELYALIKSYHP